MLVAQRSFAAGEISPALYARCDAAKYATSLRQMRNFFTRHEGGAQNRPGTVFVCEVKDSTKDVRLLPFRFNDAQTYILEFGDHYVRFIQNGAQLSDSQVNITGISNAVGAVVTAAAHGFSNGQEVSIAGVLGMTQLNGENFKIGNVTTNTFKLYEMDGVTPVDSSALEAYVSGGQAARIFEIVSPYAAADVALLDYAQSGDVLTLTHVNYPVQQLSRLGQTSWTFTQPTFAPKNTAPTGVAIVPQNVGTWVIQKFRTSDNHYGIVSSSATGTYAAHAPAILTWSAEPGFDYLVFRHNGTQYELIGHVVQANGLASGYFTDPGIPTPTGSPPGPPDTFISAPNWLVVSTNQPRTTLYLVTAVDTESSEESLPSTSVNGYAEPSEGAPNALTWTAVAGQSYRVYKSVYGVYGFVGVSSTGSFSDTGIPPDYTRQPPSSRNPFVGTGNYPGAVSFVQQRLTFAGSSNNPSRVWTSKTGNYLNFSVAIPTTADDALTFDLVGRDVQQIAYLCELGNTITFTSSGEWGLLGDGSAAAILSPGNIGPKQYGYNGAAKLKPIVVSSDALYVQARGARVRDLSYRYSVSGEVGYIGDDLNEWSSHIVDGYTLLDWTYQRIYNSVLWAVRSDGVLLGLTYNKAQQIFGWHRHDTLGSFRNTCSVPEGVEDAAYFVVLRTINGAVRRYIERLDTMLPIKKASDLLDRIYCDSALTFDGRNTSAMTMTLSGGTAWSHEENLTLTASAGFFTTRNVGDEIQITATDGSYLRFAITGYTSATVVTGKADRTVPESLRSIPGHPKPTAIWARAVKKVAGLRHLEGQAISATGDGFVISSPNNTAYPTVIVQDAEAEFDRPYAVIHAGLPYVSDIETLDIDMANGESLADKKILIGEVILWLWNSRGVFAGGEPPADGGPALEGLYEKKGRWNESYDAPPSMTTGKERIVIGSQWSEGGRVFLRQTEPLPLTILSIFPRGYVPAKGAA